MNNKKLWSIMIRKITWYDFTVFTFSSCLSPLWFNEIFLDVVLCIFEKNIYLDVEWNIVYIFIRSVSLCYYSMTLCLSSGRISILLLGAYVYIYIYLLVSVSSECCSNFSVLILISYLVYITHLKSSCEVFLSGLTLWFLLLSIVLYILNSTIGCIYIYNCYLLL